MLDRIPSLEPAQIEKLPLNGGKSFRLGFLEAFRTLCVSPPAEMKVLMDDMKMLEQTRA